MEILASTWTAVMPVLQGRRGSFLPSRVLSMTTVSLALLAQLLQLRVAPLALPALASPVKNQMMLELHVINAQIMSSFHQALAMCARRAQLATIVVHRACAPSVLQTTSG